MRFSPCIPSTERLWLSDMLLVEGATVEWSRLSARIWPCSNRPASCLAFCCTCMRAYGFSGVMLIPSPFASHLSNASADSFCCVPVCTSECAYFCYAITCFCCCNRVLIAFCKSVLLDYCWARIVIWPACFWFAPAFERTPCG